jgi:two-component system chemotaxis response regulator CheB
MKMFTQAAAEAFKGAEAAKAQNGGELLRHIRRKDYDIIVVDADLSSTRMPELLKDIRREIPKASLLITARPSSAQKFSDLDEIKTGKTYFLEKPVNDSYENNYATIINTLRGLTVAQPNTAAAAKTASSPQIASGPYKTDLVLIASSTGGPLALEYIIPKLSADIPAPVLIVQHLPTSFAESLAVLLDQKSSLRVKVAESGETPAPGIVYAAPGGLHMKLGGDNKLYLEDTEPVNGVKPAADALFISVAESFPGKRVLVVVLTGMGRDGTKGIARLKEKTGCFCIAQSEKTCVVFGMPRVVVESGLADMVCDLEDIPNAVMRTVYGGF